jgi:MarR family transcriptional regulator, negative regulator of the multidrug operon emrRAB
MPHAVDHRAANLVGAFALALTDRMSAAIDGGGAGGSAAGALLLVHHGHVRRIDDLRAPLALTQAGVVRLVDRLAAAGLVLRVAGDAPDRRQVGVALTAKGRRRARQVLQAREDAVAGLLAGLAPEEVAALSRTCERTLAGAAAGHPAPARLCRYCDEKACDLTRCPVELATGTGGS